MGPFYLSPPAPELQATGAKAAAPAFCLDRLRDEEPAYQLRQSTRGTCSRHARPGFCRAGWRRIAQDRRGADHRPLDSRIKGRKVRRGRSCDSAEAYRNFSSMAAPCKKPSSLLRSIGQRNVLTALIQTWRCRAVGPRKALPDQPTPVKARALRARLRRLTALTGAGRPGV